MLELPKRSNLTREKKEKGTFGRKFFVLKKALRHVGF
jgi:hypothetical protein